MTHNIAADQATGCRQHPAGIGKAYDDKGEVLHQEAAQTAIWAGRAVAFPNAGAGSYERVFAWLGFDEVRAVDWGSSAGDWVFGVRNDDCWLPAFQTNRHPYHGFAYSVNFAEGAESFEELCSSLEG